MADNVTITEGSGKTIAADEVADGTLGTATVQYVKIMDGALGGTDKIGSGSGVATGALRVVQAVDSVSSVAATDLDIRDLANATDSVSVYQVSGALWSVSVTSPAALDVKQVSGSIDSVYVTGAAASVYAEIMNPDGRVKVELPTGASGLTDTELRAAHLDVQQVSGSTDSVYVTGAAASTYAEIMNPDGRVKVELPTGSSGLTDTELRASALDVKQVSGSIDSVSVTNTVTVTGSLTSAVVVGPTVADTADDGSAPIQMGGVARTANPTAVAANDIVKATFDDVGRQLMRPMQVRDLIKTAYVSVANGTETTLLAGVAGAYLDLVYVMGSNNSDAAVSVDLRAVTAGNIVATIVIPPYGTAGVAAPVPIPQSDTGNNWTVDLPDQTGTTVTLSALFSQEV